MELKFVIIRHVMCKCNSLSAFMRIESGINRTFMELKFYLVESILVLTYVLIVPLWYCCT
jgi:hypothetical protein